MTHGRVTAPQMEDKVQRVCWRGWWLTGSSRSYSRSRKFILLSTKWQKLANPALNVIQGHREWHGSILDRARLWFPISVPYSNYIGLALYLASFPRYNEILIENRKFLVPTFIWRLCWGWPRRNFTVGSQSTLHRHLQEQPEHSTGN